MTKDFIDPECVETVTEHTIEPLVKARRQLSAYPTIFNKDLNAILLTVRNIINTALEIVGKLPKESSKLPTAEAYEIHKFITSPFKNTKTIQAAVELIQTHIKALKEHTFLKFALNKDPNKAAVLHSVLAMCNQYDTKNVNFSNVTRMCGANLANERSALLTHVALMGMLRVAPVHGLDQQIAPIRNIYIHGRKGRVVTDIDDGMELNGTSFLTTSCNYVSYMGKNSAKEYFNQLSVGGPFTGYRCNLLSAFSGITAGRHGSTVGVLLKRPLMPCSTATVARLHANRWTNDNFEQTLATMTINDFIEDVHEGRADMETIASLYSKSCVYAFTVKNVDNLKRILFDAYGKNMCSAGNTVDVELWGKYFFYPLYMQMAIIQNNQQTVEFLKPVVAMLDCEHATEDDMICLGDDDDVEDDMDTLL